MLLTVSTAFTHIIILRHDSHYDSGDGSFFLYHFSKPCSCNFLLFSHSFNTKQPLGS
jgi:hypothetical protein